MITAVTVTSCETGDLCGTEACAGPGSSQGLSPHPSLSGVSGLRTWTAVRGWGHSRSPGPRYCRLSYSVNNHSESSVIFFVGWKAAVAVIVELIRFKHKVKTLVLRILEHIILSL